MPTLIGYPFERLLYFYHCILHVYKSLLSVASFGMLGQNSRGQDMQYDYIKRNIIALFNVDVVHA